ncbi:hypothetical protein BDF14DRAFT_1824037 [Spinellus fusiger]|nr:hypothetical protein BDF14DRAFT_1824037 [Spinellus fusiger]
MFSAKLFKTFAIARPTRRLYSTDEVAKATKQNNLIMIGASAAAGLGVWYYFHKKQQREELSKGAIQKTMEKAGAQAQSAYNNSKEALDNKLVQTKESMEDKKAQASAKYEALKQQGVEAAENGVDAVKQKSADIQTATGEKVKQTGEKIKEATNY